MRLLVDTSNVVKAGLFNGKDEEGGRKVDHNGKMTLVNGAEYGFDAAVRFINARLSELDLAPKDIIFVTESTGANALRKSISDTYKANRSGKYPPETGVQVNLAQEMLLKQFLDLGALAVTQPGLEADDIIAYLARELPATIILSTDGDMQQCISEKAHLWYKGAIDENRYGPWPTKYTTLYKSLVGDTNDNIKGARGFGDEAFKNLYCLWGDEGLDVMQELIQQRRLEELQEDVGDLKALQKIVDDRDGVYLSWKLACQYPENVNVWRRPLEWRAGMVKAATADTHPDIVKWGARRKVVHQANFEATLAFLRVQLAESTESFLDIETSGSDESDEWLLRKAKKSDKADKVRIDKLGSTLTGMGLTVGKNHQYSMYFTVDHVETPDCKNLTKGQIRQVIEAVPEGMPIVVHNADFELSIMAREVPLPKGDHGFIPNVVDTRVMASYVNEEEKHGLKDLSSVHLKYEQVTYAEVTQGRRMNQMTAAETLAYGTDDTVCTAAHFNRMLPILQLERTWQVMLDVEQDAAYMGALSYNHGAHISMERMLELEREDQAAFAAAWVTLRDFLLVRGWEGSVCPGATIPLEVTPAFVKEAYQIVTGEELDCKMRLLPKLAAFIESKGQPMLAFAINAAAEGDVSHINKLLKLHFKGEPVFSVDSPNQCCKLLYDVLNLPIRITNDLTVVQRGEGRSQGNPKADDYAIQWALQDDLQPGTPEYLALKALQVMKVTNTRRKLYYEPYKVTQHWKDNLVHSDLRQCGPVTRRYSDSDPNKQQLPKRRLPTGELPKFRQVYVPHHRRAVIVSLDFKGQELAIIASESQDPNLLACFVGDEKKDMHALTGAAILKKKALAMRIGQLAAWAGTNPDDNFRMLVEGWKAIDYAGFKLLEKDPLAAGVYKAIRELGKKTNFTTEYGAQKRKLSETLLVPQDEAQEYLDARVLSFGRAEAWKREVIEELHKVGYARTMMGARRHLAHTLVNGSKYEIGGAERQAVNFRVQGSAAEQTKLAMGRFWRAGICFKYDAKFIGPIHDEVVFSVCIDDLIPFLHEVHALMVAPYATMTVPIISTVSFGVNFGEQIEMGEAVNDEMFEDELVKLFPDEYKQAA